MAPETNPGPGEVRLRRAVCGVCGSDQHCYNQGGFGAVRPREPMILGHEVSARVEALGEGVGGATPGQLVAVSPLGPRRKWVLCQEGFPSHCPNMPFSHVNGAFGEVLLADAAQCVDTTGLSPAEAAMAGPLAVTLDATARTGSLLGKQVLFTGCGPIRVLCNLAARRVGAVEIVATDHNDFTRGAARTAGADLTLNLHQHPQPVAAFSQGRGHSDVPCECSGTAAGPAGGIAALRPRGGVLQLVLGGDMALPIMAITARQLELCESFRFHAAFATDVALMRQGLIDVGPPITHTVPLDPAETAFLPASDRATAMTAQIVFSA